MRHSHPIIKTCVSPLKPASAEQLSVVSSVADGYNVLVDSVAGSGKTTTNLHLATAFKEKRICLVTYNSKLRIETRERASDLQLQNIAVHTYHSFCVAHYGQNCKNDDELQYILDTDCKPHNCTSFAYDLLIFDEVQDMDSRLYTLACKIMRNSTKKRNIQLVVMGDRRQCIYEYKGSDQRYILLAREIFDFCNRKWMTLELTETFRCTSQLSHFVNECMFANQRNGPRLRSRKNGTLPRYVICNVFGGGKENALLDELSYYLFDLHIDPSDIFVLAPSVRKEKSPARVFENQIATSEKFSHVSIFVPSSDDCPIDPDTVRGKLVFSSFHQAKGLERRVVLLFGFDGSYFNFYNRKADPKFCTNALYVAATRATEHVSFFHHYRSSFFDFLPKDQSGSPIPFLEEYSQLLQKREYECQAPRELSNTRVSVTDLIRHLRSEVMQNCLKKVNIKRIRMKGISLGIPTKIKSKKNQFEFVADVTGIAIPMYFEFLKKGKMSAVAILKTPDEHNLSNTVQNALKKFELQCCGITDSYWDCQANSSERDPNFTKNLLRLAAKVSVASSGFVNKLTQIENFTWLTDEKLEQCCHRLDVIGISAASNFEIPLEKENASELRGKILQGVIDCVDEPNIFEFKCTTEIDDSHILQAALYMYLWNVTGGKDTGDPETLDAFSGKYVFEEYDELFYFKCPRCDLHFKVDNPSLDIRACTICGLFVTPVDNTPYIEMLSRFTRFLETSGYPRNMFVYNILTDEMLQLTASRDDLIAMVDYLLQQKEEEYVPDNSEFLTLTQSIKERYFPPREKRKLSSLES